MCCIGLLRHSNHLKLQLGYGKKSTVLIEKVMSYPERFRNAILKVVCLPRKLQNAILEVVRNTQKLPNAVLKVVRNTRRLLNRVLCFFAVKQGVCCVFTGVFGESQIHFLSKITSTNIVLGLNRGLFNLKHHHKRNPALFPVIKRSDH